MAGTITMGDYTIPFDEEIFAATFDNQPDLVSNAMLASGAMAEDGYIASLIAGGSNVYTMPFYGALADDEDENYDGQTDITLDTLGASQQTGVVYGRAHGWYADDFAADFTTANPLAAIAARMAKYWQNKRQARLIGITEAVLSLTEMKSHVVTRDQLELTTLSDACQEIWGEHKNKVSLAIMHSAVAQQFEDMERVEYLKYTDAAGLTRDLNVYTVNGITTIIDDGVPVTAASGSGDSAKPATYTTYLFGEGAIRHAAAPVARPVFYGRDELKRGGMEYLGNRFRETIHPNGFSFTLPASTVSPTDAQLTAKANWSLAYDDCKAIPFAKLVTPAVRA